MLSIILFVFRAQIIGMFSIDPKIITIEQTILIAQLYSTLFAALSTFFTSIFQAFGTSVQSTIMSVFRGIIFVPILILGNSLFAVNGVICSNTISEGPSCIVGFIMWLMIRRKNLLEISMNE